MYFRLNPGADLTASLEKHNIIPRCSYSIAAYREAMKSEPGVTDSIVLQCYEKPANTFHLLETSIKQWRFDHHHCRYGRSPRSPSHQIVGNLHLEIAKISVEKDLWVAAILRPVSLWEDKKQSTTQIENFAEEPHHRQDL
ncbi:hypothetical protein Q3G72_012292 [Acer saccharum]|nr:hypothetical protein Q3G72_012292 [Acer saccharum]